MQNLPSNTQIRVPVVLPQMPLQSGGGMRKIVSTGLIIGFREFQTSFQLKANRTSL